MRCLIRKRILPIPRTSLATIGFSWIAREGKLQLSVAIRSNDAMWGFSGANAFESSILQEVMAYWLSLDVGRARYFAHSFHLYDQHFNRARQIDEGFHGRDALRLRHRPGRVSNPVERLPREA